MIKTIHYKNVKIIIKKSKNIFKHIKKTKNVQKHIQKVYNQQQACCRFAIPSACLPARAPAHKMKESGLSWVDLSSLWRML